MLERGNRILVAYRVFMQCSFCSWKSGENGMKHQHQGEETSLRCRWRSTLHSDLYGIIRPVKKAGSLHSCISVIRQSVINDHPSVPSPECKWAAPAHDRRRHCTIASTTASTARQLFPKLESREAEGNRSLWPISRLFGISKLTSKSQPSHQAACPEDWRLGWEKTKHHRQNHWN